MVVKEMKGRVTALKANRRGEWGIQGRAKAGRSAAAGNQEFLGSVPETQP